MDKPVSFYAVTGGRCSGIFTSRSRVLDATVGFPGAKVGKFSTLAEADKFMTESASGARGEPIVNGWQGPVYAVSVGRRMGIFREQSQALKQTLRYSGNSLKRFPSYSEAVAYLDHHNWRKMPESDDDSGVVLSNDRNDLEGDTDSSDAATSVVSSEPPPTRSSELSPKRERDDKEQSDDGRPTQRRRVTREPPVSTEGAIAIAICSGSLTTDSEGGDTMEVACDFPLHPEWSVVHQLHSPHPTAIRAGLESVVEAVRILSREDPDSDAAMTIFTKDQPLFDVLCQCAEHGWQSVRDFAHQDLLQQISREKEGRGVKLLQIGGGVTWGAQ